MRYQSVDTPCELLEEMHCAVLKLLVNDKKELNLPKHSLPDMVTEAEDSSSEHNTDSAISTPVPDADAPAHSTRSRLSHVDPSMEYSRSPAVVEKVYRAAEMLGERKWIERIAARDFEDGGWQVIVVGILFQLSLSPSFKKRADEVLAWLAPMDSDPTRETARRQFASMNINLRVSALQMITILSISTPNIKEFLETCSDDMTDVRKRKIEHQRAKKSAMEELAIKDRERKIMLPDNMPAESPPKQDSEEPTISVNGDADESMEANGTLSSDPEDDAPTMGRSLRRGNDRKRKREEEAARAAEENKKPELANQQPEQSKEFRKILADIEELKKQIDEHEGKISDCDADLREANVQRTKLLGRDRFANRYYWFERNGQPFGGLPSSSTASYGYANGRIWVQGPDDMEIEGFIERGPEEQAEYRKRFGCTVPERRQLEEGATILQSAREWGYYDDPAVLDNLIGWLDDRGEREKMLRKELFNWRDTIAQYMDAHKKFMDEQAAKKIEADEEHASRISTRNKTHEEASAARQRCRRSGTSILSRRSRRRGRRWRPSSRRASPSQSTGRSGDRALGCCVALAFGR